MGGLHPHNIAEQSMGLEIGWAGSALSPLLLIFVTLGRLVPDDLCKTQFPYLSAEDDNILEVNFDRTSTVGGT